MITQRIGQDYVSCLAQRRVPYEYFKYGVDDFEPVCKFLQVEQLIYRIANDSVP